MTEEDFNKMYSDTDVNGVRYFTMNKIIKDFIQTKERIVNLEKELAISEHDREHNDYELTEVYKKIAELKDDNKVMADNYSKMEQKFYDNLTKAKEIINDLLETPAYTTDWEIIAEKAKEIIKTFSVIPEESK